ncbi:Uncharacterized protein TCM_032610 [Theobroma cacao]|uniref:Reverse transcriptase domain-containing protein n=1 Tax=Theobroma cacao TaxID=3641 RepID=A0A061F967_THECC|nr:Uncharacterized protein TCM_032610 [Theobroma cacao]
MIIMGCFCKIIAKTLALRMRKVIGEAIGVNQFVFIQGRQFLDCAFIASEMVDLMKKNRRGSLFLKVDFEKAFDSIAWDFLYHTMRLMGFRDKWCKWVMAYVSTTTISILVNGTLTREIHMGKGLRQGGPLSLLLFNLVVEVFSALMYKAINRKHFKAMSGAKDKFSKMLSLWARVGAKYGGGIGGQN